MSMMTAGERRAFGSSVRGTLARLWSATEAGSADLAALWTAAAEQGWFDLGGSEQLDAALTVAAECGRVACPLPVLDGFVAAALFPELRPRIADGTVRVVAAPPLGPMAAASGRWASGAERGGPAEPRCVGLGGMAVPDGSGVLGGSAEPRDVGLGGSAVPDGSAEPRGARGGSAEPGEAGPGASAEPRGARGGSAEPREAGPGGSAEPPSGAAQPLLRRRYVEAAAVATHILLLGVDRACLHPIVGHRRTDGLAVPSWSDVECRAAPEHGVEYRDGQHGRARAQLRLGLAARAHGAAARTHELAVEHARTRRQFGRVIGGFGAVAQRVAACEIDVRAGQLLLDGAAHRFGSGASDRLVAAEVAIEHVRATAPSVQLGAQHTLAAVGYFEEHEGPWLFRRVHADVAALHGWDGAVGGLPGRGGLAEQLVEGGHTLPSFELGPDGEALRGQVRAFVAEHRRPDGGFDPDTVVAAMARRGWFGLGWPSWAGGREASLAEQVVLNEEITYARVPATLPMASVLLLGGSILRHGSAEQRDAFLPLIRRGELRFCLGYSEPEAGSDLASLRTRAVRRGRGWVINGQKLWTTGGQLASHVWLATRTDPDASPRHAGLTVFLVPMDTPGITVHRHRALSGEVSCTVFYDDVRVPDSARVGPVDGGWAVITDALAGERVQMGGIAAALHRQLDDLLDLARADPVTALGPPGSARRARLAGIAVRVQATRALVAAAIGALAGAYAGAGAGSAGGAGGGGRSGAVGGTGAAPGGGVDVGGGAGSRAAGDAELGPVGRAEGGRVTDDAVARLAAPMAGVLAGEVAEEFGEVVLEILGPAAALGASAPGAPGGGAFEYGLRLSPMYVIGGGTNDIQRGLIARGLGLPR